MGPGAAGADRFKLVELLNPYIGRRPFFSYPSNCWSLTKMHIFSITFNRSAPAAGAPLNNQLV